MTGVLQHCFSTVISNMTDRFVASRFSMVTRDVELKLKSLTQHRGPRFLEVEHRYVYKSKIIDNTI